MKREGLCQVCFLDSRAGGLWNHCGSNVIATLLVTLRDEEEVNAHVPVSAKGCEDSGREYKSC